MKKVVYLLLIMVLTLVCIPVHAKDNFYADQNLKLDKEYTSTIFAAGNNVSVTGKVDGISFVAGNDVTVKNDRDYLFAGGNKVIIEEVNTKDAFIAGSIIEINNSTIRDLYAAGEEINLSSEVTGNAYLGGTTVIINSTIKGDVKVSADNIQLGENAVIEGTLKYPEGVKLDKKEGATIGKEKTYKEKTKSKTETAKDMFIEFIVLVLSMILIGIILLAVNKKAFKSIEKFDQKVSFMAKTTLLGFAALVLVPIAALILITSTIGIGLSVICLLLYGIMFYLSVIPTAYYLGNWILKDKIENKYLLLTISILVIYVLRLIPFVGGIVTLISLCFGLGVYVKLIKENISTK